MPNELRTELEDFTRFVSDRLAMDQSLSLEEALDLWRAENVSADEFDENVTALREALAELDSGNKGIPLDEFDRRFRERNSLSPRQ